MTGFKTIEANEVAQHSGYASIKDTSILLTTFKRNTKKNILKSLCAFAYRDIKFTLTFS